MKVLQYSKREGVYQKEKRSAIYKSENERFMVACMTMDEKINNLSEETVKKIGSFVSDYLFLLGEDIFEFSEKKISFLIVEQILYDFKKLLVSENLPNENFEKSLLFCFVDKQELRVMFFNLKGGAVFISDEDRCKLVLSPNVENMGFLFSGSQAFKLAKIKIQDIKIGETILLCSKDFYGLMGEREGEMMIKEALKAENFDGLRDYLEMQDDNADYSFIFITNIRSHRNH